MKYHKKMIHPVVEYNKRWNGWYRLIQTWWTEYSGHKCHYHLVIRWYIYVWLKFSPHQLSIEFNCFFSSQNAQNETRISNFYHGIYFIFVWNKWMFFLFLLLSSISWTFVWVHRCIHAVNTFFLSALLINIDNYCVIINYIWPSYANLGFPFKWNKSQLNEVRKRERAR